MISYEDPIQLKGVTLIFVKLEGKRIGVIKSSPEGWFYAPKTGKVTSERFPTLRELKNSIEGD